MRIYLSGPISRVSAKVSAKRFDGAERRLKQNGHSVCNPLALDRRHGKLPTWADYMKRDIPLLVKCDGIRLLEGWEDSDGAKLEWYLAEKLGITLVDADGSTVQYFAKCDVPASGVSILVEADKLVNGPRQASYGHPIEDFTRTGKIWGAILGTAPVPPEVVGLCMVGVKISREVNRPKTDNRRDGAGYFGAVDLVMDKLGKKDPS